MKKALKMTGISIAILFVVVIIGVLLFIFFSPQFGKGASKEQKKIYKASGHYKKGKFVNESRTEMNVHYWDLIKEMRKEAPNRKPLKDITTRKIPADSIGASAHKATKLTWLGHSTFILEIQDLVILIDPMFGDSPSPVPFMGSKRYSKELPVNINDLPFIDAVILSHDHYDHLDYRSIKKLQGKVGHYFTPLGVGNHLEAWGIDRKQIHELNWWDSVRFNHLTLVCAPSRHFSGRGLFDRSKTLWGSWVILGINEKIYFSGDGGYDTHFKEIGAKYGPFDIALMECGQYHTDWKLIHMMPEETVQAAIDVKSKLTVPIHWGVFTLALHDWTDPVERMLNKAGDLNVPVATPEIGETMVLGDTNFPVKRWWEDYLVTE